VRRIVIVALAAVVGFACSTGKPHKRSVRVAAAADLTRAFEELGSAFEAKTGITPVFTFGSSGLLAKQIAQGAPFALFAAASREYVDQAVDSGRCDRASMIVYARGQIGVWTPNGIAPPAKLEELTDPRFEHVAIANPDHAPYGKAAKQALQSTHVWDALENRIVLGDSVLATMQMAQSRSAQSAIVARSLAIVTDGGTFMPIDPTLYDPLDQALVLCGKGDETDAARELSTFVMSASGREIMTRYGFVLPGT
jgi:molybdate transport system substrate-binding protein